MERSCRLLVAGSTGRRNMRDEIVPDRLRFRISVNKNNGHRSYSPNKHCRTCLRAQSAEIKRYSLSLRA
jgi:hypothetical protein